MLLPIGDEPNEHGTPVVNYALIAANVLVFLFVQGAGKGAAYEASIERWAYVPAAPSILTAFTSMFLHGGWMHLVGNMLFLWIFGDNCEARFGRLGYLCAYLATGVVAGLIHGMSDPSSAVPSLGASGAISGVEGLYLVAFPRNRVKLLILWFYVFNVVYVPAPWLIVLWFALNDLLPSLLGGSNLGGVAHTAHLGGFAAGVVLCLIVRPFLKPAGLASVSQRAAPRSKTPATQSPWMRTDPYGGGRTAAPSRGATGSDEPTIQGLWKAGRWEQAADLFAIALREGRSLSIPESDYLRMAMWLEEHRRFDDAKAAFYGFLRAYPSSRSAGLASFGLGLILARHDHDGHAARPHLEAAARTAPDATVRAAAARELEGLGFAT